MVATHHTKDKGDLGVAKVHADLVGAGYCVLFPATEHAAFDLVAYREGEFRRVQVKYRAARRGALTVHFRSLWVDRHGTHSTPTDKSEIDLLAVYCPDTDECYFLRPGDYGQSVTIRISPPRNNQTKGVVLGTSVRQVPR